MAAERHRKQEPPEGPPDEGPSGGLTCNKLVAKAIEPWVPLILKIVDWLLHR